MAISQSMLAFVGLLAASMSYIGLFKPFAGGDRWTRVLLLFGGAILWGMFGLSANDVIVGSNNMVTLESVTMLPLVYLGYGAAFVVALFGIFEMFQAITGQTSDAADGIMS